MHARRRQPPTQPTHYNMQPSSDAEKTCILALMHTPGIGAVTIRQLISYCGSASQVFQADYKRLIKIPGIGDKIVKAVLGKSSLELAESAITANHDVANNEQRPAITQNIERDAYRTS